jgi:succinate dehydrogenase / fumarate reductase, cytochrome b subunit
MAEATNREPPKVRPVYTNLSLPQLMQYRLPLAGFLSILHRVSGALLFLVGLPFVLYLFDQSITSEISFTNYQSMVGHWAVKLVLLALIWSYLHHFCAGIRYLLLDMHMGIEKGQAKTSAAICFAISLTLTFIIALKLFGAF